jgi:hypothetical protein
VSILEKYFRSYAQNFPKGLKWPVFLYSIQKYISTIYVRNFTEMTLELGIKKPENRVNCLPEMGENRLF